MNLLKFAATALLLALTTLICAAPAAAQTVEYVHTDALGSVVAVTDANRNIVESREYEPYGHQLTPTLQNGPGYTGHVQDASTGLTYMQQRYYDPLLGRFLSVDPVTMHDTGDARHFNRYGYANNNPYSYVDPDGRLAWFVVVPAVISLMTMSDYAQAPDIGEAPTVMTNGERVMAIADAVPLSRPLQVARMAAKSGGDGGGSNNGPSRMKTIVEDAAAAKKADGLQGAKAEGYEKVKDTLARGEAGRNQHDLKGDLAGKSAADLPGSGRGRGAERVVFSKTEDQVIIHDITDYHKK